MVGEIPLPKKRGAHDLAGSWAPSSASAPSLLVASGRHRRVVSTDGGSVLRHGLSDKSSLRGHAPRRGRRGLPAAVAGGGTVPGSRRGVLRSGRPSLPSAQDRPLLPADGHAVSRAWPGLHALPAGPRAPRTSGHCSRGPWWRRGAGGACRRGPAARALEGHRVPGRSRGDARGGLAALASTSGAGVLEEPGPTTRQGVAATGAVARAGRVS